MKNMLKGAVLGTLASVLLLSGCSNEPAAPQEEKRVCTVDGAAGVEGLGMTITATGTDNEVNTVDFEIKMDLQAMLEASGSGVEVNLEDMDESLKTTLTDSMKEEMSKSIASELGIAEDAVSADASIDGNVMNISMSMDVDKMGDTYAGGSLDEFAQQMEEQLNATCK